MLHLFVLSNKFKSELDSARLDKIKKQTGNEFLTSDKNLFFEYANYANIMIGNMANYERMSKTQQQKAKELIKLLEEELEH